MIALALAHAALAGWQEKRPASRRFSLLQSDANSAALRLKPKPCKRPCISSKGLQVLLLFHGNKNQKSFPSWVILYMSTEKPYTPEGKGLAGRHHVSKAERRWIDGSPWKVAISMVDYFLMRVYIGR